MILLTGEAAGGMSLWTMVVKGGWLMIPIFAASIVAIYIICERFWLIRKTGVTDDALMERLAESLRQGDHEGAAKACEEEGSPLARVLAKGIRTREEDAGEVRRGMEETANKEVAAIERGLPTLATCAGIAPMIGFLGTVVGMVQSFYDMSTAGNSIDIGLLSRGSLFLINRITFLYIFLPWITKFTCVQEHKYCQDISFPKFCQDKFHDHRTDNHDINHLRHPR